MSKAKWSVVEIKSNVFMCIGVESEQLDVLLEHINMHKDNWISIETRSEFIEYVSKLVKYGDRVVVHDPSCSRFVLIDLEGSEKIDIR